MSNKSIREGSDCGNTGNPPESLRPAPPPPSQHHRSTRKAVVLLSGGQDSSTCLFWALKVFSEVIAVGFDYGQKHRAELDQAQKIAALAGVEYKIFDVRGILGGSSLTDHTLDHNRSHARNSDLPASFTAGRNALFLTIAGAFAYSRGITDIVTGICQTDYSGYPDCRDEFRYAQEKALSLAVDADFDIHAPLMFLTKAQTWKLAKDLGCLEIVRDYSMTDYNGAMQQNEWGYGNLDNPASVIRARGYEEAKKRGWI